MRWLLGAIVVITATLAWIVTTRARGMSIGMCASATLGSLVRSGGVCRSAFELRAPPRAGRSVHLVAPVCHPELHEPGVALDVDGVAYGLVACGVLERDGDAGVCDGQRVTLGLRDGSLVVSVGDRVLAEMAPPDHVEALRWCMPG